MASAKLAGPADLDDDEREAVKHLLHRLADDEYVIAERYTEWQVRSPTLESDLALSNIAQDELGHARLWFDLLADFGAEESELIWERPPGEWRHSTLTELPWPEGGWADAVVRGYLYDVAEDLRLAALEDSSYGRIRDRVGKVVGEEDYHLDHAENWLERLAEDDGEEPRSSDSASGQSPRASGQERLQDAVDRQFTHALTLFEPTDPEIERRIDDLGLRTRSLSAMGEDWLARVVPFLESLGLETPMGDGREVTDELLPPVSGRDGEHTDDWFDLYDEFTETYEETDIGGPVKLMREPDDE
jgi:ring-1,2-phenylacetyl-CoA epoxidase subunit PaaC